MGLEELSDLIGQDIEVVKHHGEKRWLASMRNIEIQEDAVLVSCFGCGITPIDAIHDFCDRIKGQKIVVNAFTDKRQEFNIPRSLEW